MTKSLYDSLQESATYIRKQIGSLQPKIGLILGSGLGKVADSLENRIVISYREIPGFPVPSVEGHAGEIVAGKLGDHAVI